MKVHPSGIKHYQIHCTSIIFSLEGRVAGTVFISELAAEVHHILT